MAICLCQSLFSFLLFIALILSKQAKISSVTIKDRTDSLLVFTCVNPGLLFFFFVGVS